MLRRFLLTGLTIGGVPFGAPSSFEAFAQAPPAVTLIEVEGTEIVVHLPSRQTLRSHDLVGAMLKVRFENQATQVRIIDVQRDPIHRSGTVWFHSFEASLDGTWKILCSAGPDGRRQGFPMQGASGALEFTCTSGAIGKCFRFGYRPWAGGPTANRWCRYMRPACA